MMLLAFVRRLAMANGIQSSLGPRPLVLCGPSGSGKSTLIKQLMNDFKDVFGFSVSHTTRSPRPGEIDGKDYHYVSKEVMQDGINNGEFIESAIYAGNIYGTSKKSIQDVQLCNRICILDIDSQGVKSIKQTQLYPLYVFVQPPSMEVLEQRLRARSTETEESLQKRLQIAKVEMEYGTELVFLFLNVFFFPVLIVSYNLGSDPKNFDIVIVNDQLEKSYEELKNFLLPFIKQIRK